MKLQVRFDGKKLEHKLTGDELILGRGSDCGLRIIAEGVSRKHAKITQSEDKVFIEDLGSSNGTFINEERIEKAQLTSFFPVKLGPSVEIDLITDEDDSSAGIGLKAHKKALSTSTRSIIVNKKALNQKSSATEQTSTTKFAPKKGKAKSAKLKSSEETKKPSKKFLGLGVLLLCLLLSFYFLAPGSEDQVEDAGVRSPKQKKRSFSRDK